MLWENSFTVLTDFYFLILTCLLGMNLIIFLGLKLRFLFAVVCNLFDVEGSWVIFYYESLRVHKPPNAGLVFDEITNKLAKSHSEVDFQVPEYVFYIGNCFVNEFALAGLNYRTRSHAFHVGHILLDIGNLFRRVEVLFICYNPAVGIFILSPNSAANKCFRAIALDKLLYHGSLVSGCKNVCQLDNQISCAHKFDLIAALFTVNKTRLFYHGN